MIPHTISLFVFKYFIVEENQAPWQEESRFLSRQQGVNTGETVRRLTVLSQSGNSHETQTGLPNQALTGT